MSLELDEFFGREPKKEVNYSELNKRQMQAVQTTEGSVLIIAGAGTGKTKTLVYRLANLIDQGVDPRQILLLTFTNKAAEEMLLRAQKLLDERVNDITSGTYHSFCSKILREYSTLVNLKENFNVLSQANSLDFINRAKAELKLSKDRSLPDAQKLQSIFSFSINKGKTIEETLDIKFNQFEDCAETIKAIQDEYNRQKIESNTLDFDDMLTYVVKIFEEHPDICKKYSKKYKYIMVDEYQDSNELQMRILELLRNYDEKNICVVGDDAQAIYGFRGSNYKNILKFPNQYKDTKIIKLINNYRSNQEILDLANAIINNAPANYEKQLISEKISNKQPKLVHVNDENQEAEYVIYKIWQYHIKGVPFKDMAVLIRNSSKSNRMEMKIMEMSGKRNIPFKKIGGKKFMDKEIVQDILAFLSVINNPQNQIFWYRILKLFPGIGEITSNNITKDIAKNGIEILIDKKYESKKYSTYFPELYSAIDYMKEIDDIYRLVDYLINNYYYKVKKRAIEESDIGERRGKKSKADYLNTLDSDIQEVQILKEIAKKSTNLNEFLDSLTIDGAANDAEEETGDYLTISTIHSAKGLEFKIVFILDCVDEVIPGERQLKSFSKEAIEEHNEELEEERRLLYVAITRAKDGLYLINPKLTYKYNKVEATNLCRFLEENNIYKDYCDNEYLS